MIMSATRVPPATEIMADLKSIFIKAAARELVQAPVPGSGIATKISRAQSFVSINFIKFASSLSFQTVNQFDKAGIAHPIEDLIDKQKNKRRRQNCSHKTDEKCPPHV